MIGVDTNILARFYCDDPDDPESVRQRPRARRVMLESHARYMPVVDDRTPVGVISFHDVAKARLEEQTFESRMLKGFIKSSME